MIAPLAHDDCNMRDYERMKAEWIAQHPDATPDEYARAMREIAQRCGV